MQCYNLHIASSDYHVSLCLRDKDTKGQRFKYSLAQNSIKIMMMTWVMCSQKLWLDRNRKGRDTSGFIKNTDIYSCWRNRNSDSVKLLTALFHVPVLCHFTIIVTSLSNFGPQDRLCAPFWSIRSGKGALRRLIKADEVRNARWWSHRALDWLPTEGFFLLL